MFTKPDQKKCTQEQEKNQRYTRSTYRRWKKVRERLAAKNSADSNEVLPVWQLEQLCSHYTLLTRLSADDVLFTPSWWKIFRFWKQILFGT